MRSSFGRMAFVAVALAALLAGGTTSILANAADRETSVSENSVVNYDGTRVDD